MILILAGPYFEVCVVAVKKKIKAREALMSKEKIVREVVIPETITVGDLVTEWLKEQLM